MCFFIDVYHQMVKTAKTNIVCWKRFDIGKGYCSPIQGFEYEGGIVYYEDQFNEHALYMVNTGLHSYSTEKEAKREKYSDEKIVKCIIPKGSKYYYNSYKEEYVSDHLFIGTEELYQKNYPYGYSNKIIK